MGNYINIHNEDCLIGMNKIQDQSIDLILVDPPYGTTPLEWDISLDFKVLWGHYNRIIKSNGVILIFGQEPFSSYIRLSNIEDYKYDWYWEKERLTNIFQVKRRPGKVIETISVFYKEQCNYFPKKTKHTGKLVSNKIGKDASFSISQSGKNSEISPTEYIDDGTRYPTQLLKFNRENNHEVLHPTQKPVDLLEYLIRTYTKENEVVLDNCMGSGSTAIACKLSKRSFIGFEKDKEIFDIANRRIKQHRNLF